jgi:hypothetical protein
MVVREAKEKGKMAANSEAVVIYNTHAGCGMAVQDSHVELKMPNTCSHGRQAPALVADEQC